MGNIAQRLRQLEVKGDGAERVIVVVWPGGNAEAAMAAKGVEARRTDLIIVVNKEASAETEGWVSINGSNVA